MVDGSNTGWQNIVFLSTLDTHRNKSEISKLWGVSVSGGPLYRDSANKGLEDYVERGLLEKRGSTYKADLDNKEFKEELAKLMDESPYSQHIKDIDNLIDFFKDDTIQNNVLTPLVVKNFFGKDKKESIQHAREASLAIFFKIVFTAIIQLWVDNKLDDVSGINNAVQGGMTGMFSGYVDDVNSTLPYNLDVVVESVKDAYEVNESCLEYPFGVFDDYANKELPF